MIGVHSLLALMLGAFAVAMLGPALVASETGDTLSAGRFLGTAALTGFVAGGLALALRGRAEQGTRRVVYAIAVGAFTLPPLIGAVPLVHATGGDVAQAVFEAISGFTTTGATIFTRLADVAPAILLWRAELQWLGGLTTLVVVVALLAPLGVGGLPQHEVFTGSGAGPVLATRLRTALRDVGGIYGAFTVVCLLALLVVGIPPFDAVCLALSTVSTGGFMPRDGGLIGYANPAAEIVLMLFMLTGATSVLWQRTVTLGRWRRVFAHRESYLVVAMAIAIGVAYAGALAAPGTAESDPFRTGLLTGISLVTTTGYPIGGPGYSALPLVLVIIVAAIGAGAFSTAGGLKFFRLGAMAVQAVHELRRLIYPHAVRVERVGSLPVDDAFLRAIWSQLAASMAVLAVSAMALTLGGLAFEAASVAAVSAFANVGGIYPGAWAEAAGWPGYADLADWQKLVLAGTMVAGRLEAIALVGAAGVALWRV